MDFTGSAFYDSRLVPRSAKTLLLTALLFGALGASGMAQAEIVARGASGGMLALGPAGTPSVAYVRGTRLVVASRAGADKWRAANAAAVPAGSTVKAFKVGAAGPAVVAQSSNDQTLFLVRKRGSAWQKIQLASVPGTMALGWPGLALDAKDLPIVAYARWNSLNLNTQLQLVRVAATGKPTAQGITRGGFPQSTVPPPAAPVLVGGRVHVVEAYGFHTVTGAFEWYPNGKTWTGFGLDVSRGEFPMGPVLAGLLQGRLVATWTQSMAAFGAAPVTLAVRTTHADSQFVLDRALASALALPSSGPEVAANEWVTSEELGLGGDGVVWAGTIVDSNEQTVELDGWIGGLAVAPKGARDVLLERGNNLEWYRSPAKLGTRVAVRALPGPDGVTVEGNVDGTSSGRVTIFREHGDGSRDPAGTAQIAGGSFSFADTTGSRPLLYRAVYTAAGTGIPYAALSRPIL
jgi:hypothetical protein